MLNYFMPPERKISIQEGVLAPEGEHIAKLKTIKTAKEDAKLVLEFSIDSYSDVSEILHISKIDFDNEENKWRVEASAKWCDKLLKEITIDEREYNAARGKWQLEGIIPACKPFINRKVALKIEHRKWKDNIRACIKGVSKIDIKALESGSSDFDDEPLPF